MKTKNTNTALAGAQKERDVFIAMFRRDKLRLEKRDSNSQFDSGWHAAASKYLKFGGERKKRYDARPGGLGRGKNEERGK